MNTNEEKALKERNPIVKVILTVLSFAIFVLLYTSISLIMTTISFNWAITIGVILSALVSVAEVLLLRKFKASRFILMLSVLMPIVIFIAIPFLVPIDFVSSFDVVTALISSVIVLTVRCAIAVIDNMFKKKAVIVVMLIAVVITLCATGFIMIDNYDKIYCSINEFVADSDPAPRDKADFDEDELINSKLIKGKNWKKIVNVSNFQLGKVKSYHNKENDHDGYMCDWGTYPLIDGSTSCKSMAVEFARQHLGFDDETGKSFVRFARNDGAYDAYESMLINEFNYMNYYLIDDDNDVEIVPDKAVDIVISAEPTKEELDMAKKAGITLVKKPVCRDALVFFTHKDNPIDNLTSDQIRDIYNGKIRNWKKIGGNNERIKAYQRGKDTDNQNIMEALVMNGINTMHPISSVITGVKGELFEFAAEYQNDTSSIGYALGYYIDKLYDKEDIKILSVNGVKPTDENIRSEKYPFTTNYYGVIRHGDENKTGGKFLDWMLSDEGQQCIAQAGYITIK